MFARRALVMSLTDDWVAPWRLVNFQIVFSISPMRAALASAIDLYRLAVVGVARFELAAGAGIAVDWPW